MKLNPDNQINLNKEVLTTILSAYGISDFTFEPIKEGIANSSAFIQSNNKKYVVRVYAQGKKDEDIAFEINFQDYLREHEIPIPVIHKNNSGQELTTIEIQGKRWQVILMDFVEGQSVTVKPSFDLIAELARMQAKMHLLGIEFAKLNQRPSHLWTDLHDGLASKVENTSVGGQEVKDLIERIKNYSYPLSPDLPYGYNHLDIDFDGNVLTKENRVSGIVDFEDLKYSPLIVCLGYSLWNILDDEGLEAMRHYLSEYEKVRPLTSLEYEALPNVVFFRNYVMAVIRLLLWEEDTPIEDIQGILKLEKEIPILLGTLKGN
jgi:Ser/Thr protein kinase RdoA (MazF antagonist)